MAGWERTCPTSIPSSVLAPSGAPASNINYSHFQTDLWKSEFKDPKQHSLSPQPVQPPASASTNLQASRDRALCSGPSLAPQLWKSLQCRCSGCSPGVALGVRWGLAPSDHDMRMCGFYMAQRTRQ